MKPVNIQIQKKQEVIIMPIDKLSKAIAKFDKDEYAEVIGDRNPCTIEEHKIKGKPVNTKYWLNQEAGFNDLTPLRWFDIGVVAFCCANFQQGGELITFDMILRALTGSTGKDFTDEQRRAVREAVIRCMSTTVTVEMAETCQKMKGYKTAKPKITGAILPCKLLENVTINGQKTDAIKMLDESPLMEIAKIKNQLLTMDASLLAVPTLKNTPRVMTVKLYVTTFALIIARSLRNKRKNTPNTLTFQKIYEAVDAGDEDRFVKRTIREVAIKVVEHLKAQGAIRDFEIVKDNEQIHAIKFFV